MARNNNTTAADHLEKIREYAVLVAQERYGWEGSYLEGGTRQEIVGAYLAVREEWLNAGRLGALNGKE